MMNLSPVLFLVKHESLTSTPRRASATNYQQHRHQLPSAHTPQLPRLSRRDKHIRTPFGNWHLSSQHSIQSESNGAGEGVRVGEVDERGAGAGVP